jgi:uncharacterized membrane protein YdcZ (DUF606 family)
MQTQLINIINNALVYALMAFTVGSTFVLLFMSFAEEISDIEKQFSQFTKKGEKLFLETGIV